MMEQMRGTDSGAWVAIGFVLMCVCVGIYDVGALLSAGKIHTASFWLVNWSMAWPFIPLMVGLIVGHLFIPQR